MSDDDGHAGLASQAQETSERLAVAESLRTLISTIAAADADASTLARVRHSIDQAIADIGPTPSLAKHRQTVESGGERTFNPFDSAENPLAPPLRVTTSAGGRYVAEFVLSAAYEGPPGRVHGGVVAGILDHASGFALDALGIVAMSVSLTINLHDATPYGEPLVVTASVQEREGRKIWVTAEVATTSGHVTASCRTLMIELANRPDWVNSMHAD